MSDSLSLASETEIVVEVPKILLDTPLEWHRSFDRGAHLPESYHNDLHVLAVEEAAITYLSKSDRANDPLGVWQDLDDWNIKNPMNFVSDYDFREIVRVSIRHHDTGNIINDIDENGNPIYLSQYTANEAEERSKKIVAKQIAKSDLDESKKEAYTLLSQTLKEETKYTKNSTKKLFDNFMRVVDQIGNELFTTNTKAVIGLLYETVAENPEAAMRPSFFFNFALEMLPGYVSDKQNMALLSIWDKVLPQRKVLADETIKIADYLNSLTA